VDILLFGRLRDTPPLGQVPATINDLDSLKSWLAANCPALVAESVRIAVNDEMVVGNRALGDDDQIAFLPPVSGG